MGLVNVKEVVIVIKVDKFGFIGIFLGWLLMKVLKILIMNKIYDCNKYFNDFEFINVLFDEFEIWFEILEEDLKWILKIGFFIIILNYFLGGIDGIFLLKLLVENCFDFKIIVNFLLYWIELLKFYVMFVNFFESYKDVKSSFMGFKNVL